LDFWVLGTGGDDPNTAIVTFERADSLGAEFTTGPSPEADFPMEQWTSCQEEVGPHRVHLLSAISRHTDASGRPRVLYHAHLAYRTPTEAWAVIRGTATTPLLHAQLLRALRSPGCATIATSGITRASYCAWRAM
jgi:hypothetical protein